MRMCGMSIQIFWMIMQRTCKQQPEIQKQWRGPTHCQLLFKAMLTSVSASQFASAEGGGCMGCTAALARELALRLRLFLACDGAGQMQSIISLFGTFVIRITRAQQEHKLC